MSIERRAPSRRKHWRAVFGRNNTSAGAAAGASFTPGSWLPCHLSRVFARDANDGALAQLVARLHGMQKVADSSSAGSTWGMSLDICKGRLVRGGHCRAPEVWHLGVTGKVPGTPRKRCRSPFDSDHFHVACQARHPVPG